MDPAKAAKYRTSTKCCTTFFPDVNKSFAGTTCPPWNAKLNPGPSSPLVTVSFASWGWWGGARFEGFVPGAGCPLGLPLAILATRFSMCGGDEANYVDGRY